MNNKLNIFKLIPISQLRRDRTGPKSINYKAGGHFHTSYTGSMIYSTFRNKDSNGNPTNNNNPSTGGTGTNTNDCSLEDLSFIQDIRYLSNLSYIYNDVETPILIKPDKNGQFKTFLIGESEGHILAGMYISPTASNNKIEVKFVPINSKGMFEEEPFSNLYKDDKFDERVILNKESKKLVISVKKDNEVYTITSCGVFQIDPKKPYYDPDGVPPNTTIPELPVNDTDPVIEIPDDNVYYLNDYKYVIFKVPVPQSGIVGFSSDLYRFNNLTLRYIKSSNDVEPSSDERKLEYTGINTNNTWLFEGATEATFRAKIPRGLNGTIYYGFHPSDVRSNLTSYSEDLLADKTNVNRFPTLLMNNNGTVEVDVKGPITTESRMINHIFLEKDVLPGQAVAFVGIQNSNNKLSSKMDRFSVAVINDKIKYKDMLSTGVPRRSEDTSLLIPFTSDHTNWHVLYRTSDNKLKGIKYRFVNDIPFSVAEQKILHEDLSQLGYDLNKPIRYVITHTPEYENSVLISNPYSATDSDLVEFGPSIINTRESNVIITDVFGEKL